MNTGTGTAARRALPAAGRFILVSALLLLPAVLRPAYAADYPRRIAIAPFSLLTPQEEIRQTVSILPRLLSSRLMAMAGAEVILLPPGEKPPAEAAREAGFPLLLQGTVAKLGKGYSIDVTATDLAAAQSAGVFFVAAGTEDEIIPRLGDLAAEISENLFGVKTVARVPTPPHAAQPAPAPTAAPLPIAPPSAPTAPPVSPAGAAPPAFGKEWVPSSMEKVGESGRITDELHGVVAGDTDSEGNGEVIAYGRKRIHLYRVSGTEILPRTRITEGLPGHILNVEAVDLDGDGAKEILVTGIEGENLRSSVWRRKGDVYEKVADRIRYFLVLLPDWQGRKVVAGQQAGSDAPFDGKMFSMSWDGKTLKKGEALPADTLRPPLSSGILGLSSARFGDRWKWIYTDENDRLRVLDPAGGNDYRSETRYGWSGDSFEWGLYLPRVGKTRYPVRKAARVSPGPGGEPLVLVPVEGEGFLRVESFSKTRRLVLLRWGGGEFVEAAGTPEGDRSYSGADFLPASGPGPEGKAVASVIEQLEGVVKGGMSRLVLFRIN